MSDQIVGTFDWDSYESDYRGGNKLVINKSINGTDEKNKCFSHEPYAQRLFDIFTNQNTELIKKDLRRGDFVRVIDIFNIKDHTIDIELMGGLTVTIDLAREKKFVQIYGMDSPKQFTASLKKDEYRSELLNSGIIVHIIEAVPSVKVSLWQGYLMSIRDEFMEQISNPTKAYKAKVLEANRGGFFVEVQGIEAFMPGSLAAPNKIIDFQSYIGKEVIVMIEDFLKEMKSFIVSHKKYLAHIIPLKIHDLDLMEKYEGTITGTSKFGVFIEFDEIFTGLLHTSKMDDETRAIFNKRGFKPGDPIEFYISEISKDNRIILTKEDPKEKLKKIQRFILESKDKVLESTVAAVMNFGVIVNVDDLNGLIPIREFKRNKIMANNYITGECINVMFDSYENDKLVFKLCNTERRNRKRED